jgi:hypothetical protein
MKKKVYSNNYRPKDVKCLIAKIKKELKSIESTGICEAIKELLAKASKTHNVENQPDAISNKSFKKFILENGLIAWTRGRSGITG